jgi:hypothetical protein
MGPILLFGFVVSTFTMVRKAQKFVLKRDNEYLYLQISSIGASFLSFLVASTFIDRLYAEILYWLPLFIASFNNIYQFKEYAGRDDLNFSLNPKNNKP